MHPPAWVCRELFNIHPQARLAWLGRPAKDDSLNVGEFCIVQLYHTRDCGTPDHPKTSRDFWYVDTRVNEFKEPYITAVDRGPIFDRNGNLKRDWDPLQRQPMIAANLEPEDVYSGAFLWHLRQKLKNRKDWQADIRSEKIQRGRDLNNRAEDQRTAFADALHFQEKHKDNAINIAKEHMVKPKESDTDFTDYYLNRA